MEVDIRAEGRREGAVTCSGGGGERVEDDNLHDKAKHLHSLTPPKPKYITITTSIY